MKLKHLLVGIATVVSVGAQAQVLPGSDRMDFLHRGAFMLIDGRVQKKVGLSAPQVDKVKKLVRSHSEKQSAFIQLSPPNVEAMNKEEDQASEAILDVLTDGQRVALKKEAIRAVGYDALLSPDIAKELNLTADQKTKIGHILDEAAAPIDKLEDIISRKIGEEPKKTVEIQRQYSYERTRLAKERKAQEAKVLTVLSPSQQASWKKMVG